MSSIFYQECILFTWQSVIFEQVNLFLTRMMLWEKKYSNIAICYLLANNPDYGS